MTDHIEFLQRVSDRGDPRGIDQIVRDAHGQLRRRRRQRLGSLVVLAVVFAGTWAALAAGDDPPTPVAAADPGDVVALVPNEGRFDVVEAYAPQHYEAPTGRLGHLAIYQQFSGDGSVSTAIAVGVVDKRQQQSTLLDVFPLAEGPVAGADGSSPMGASEATNNLVIIEAETADYRIRVAGRNLGQATVVATAESIALGDDGTIEHIDLPGQLSSGSATYDGPDISRMGMLPENSTSATYQDRKTGQRFTVLTVRDRSTLPAASLAWLFDGTVLADTPRPAVIGQQAFGDHVAYWNLDPTTSITVISADALNTNLVQELQETSHTADETIWHIIVQEHPGTETDATATTSTTTEP